MTWFESLALGLFQALFLFAVAPLFSGFARVLRAKIQNRRGPPLLQNYRDLLKLMKRQEVISEQATWMFRATPYILNASMLLVAMLIPLHTVYSPMGAAGDLILLIYLFALPRFFFALAGLDSGSPFGAIGSRRELLVSSLVEPILLLVVFVMALLSGSTNLGVITGQVAQGGLPLSMAFLLSMAAFAFALFFEMGRLPFDLAEAEQELQEGPLAEYSGRSLALMKWGLYLKQLVLTALFIALFFPYGSLVRFSWPGAVGALAAFLLKAALFYFFIAVVENVMARIRFMKAYAAAWFALGAAVMAFVFYLASV